MGKLLPLTLAIACNAELILDGGDNGWSQWYRSVDGVMGGRSSISVTPSCPRRRRPARIRRSRSKLSEGPSLDSLHSISRL